MAAQMFDPQYLDPKKQVDTAIPRFFTEAVVDERASKREGHQVFVDVEMVEVICPGDKNNIPVMPVDDSHRRRWKGVYEAFKQGQEQLPEGFPLSAWPHMSKSVVETLKSMSCHTVEQFAGMSDGHLPKLPEIGKLRDKAREFLAAQQDSALVTKLQHQVDELTKINESKDRKINDLIARMERLEAEAQDDAPRRGPGRPRKGD